MSRFVDRICCRHAWTSGADGGEFCATCGATCVRRHGRIVDYDRLAGVLGVVKIGGAIVGNIDKASIGGVSLARGRA